MIKVRTLLGNRDTIILGFTRENIDRMLNNQPVLVHGDELRYPGLNIVVIAGETFEDLREDLRAIGVIQ